MIQAFNIEPYPKKLWVAKNENWEMLLALFCYDCDVSDITQNTLDNEASALTFPKVTDSDGGYPNISGHLTISVMYGRWVFDFDNKGINGRKPQDTSFTEAAIKMAEFCIENELI